MARVGLRPNTTTATAHVFSVGSASASPSRALMLEPALVGRRAGISFDVSIQAQVLNLLDDRSANRDWPTCSYPHDLGVVRHIAHDVLVMYLGHAVERGEKKPSLRPLHPYTQALWRPPWSWQRRGERIVSGDSLPLHPPTGCVFLRCPTPPHDAAANDPFKSCMDDRLPALKPRTWRIPAAVDPPSKNPDAWADGRGLTCSFADRAKGRFTFFWAVFAHILEFS